MSLGKEDAKQIEHRYIEATYLPKNKIVQVFKVENFIADKIVVNSNAFFWDFGSMSDPSQE